MAPLAVASSNQTKESQLSRAEALDAQEKAVRDKAARKRAKKLARQKELLSAPTLGDDTASGSSAADWIKASKRKQEQTLKKQK